jgi:hypothetical protein
MQKCRGPSHPSRERWRHNLHGERQIGIAYPFREALWAGAETTWARPIFADVRSPGLTVSFSLARPVRILRQSPDPPPEPPELSVRPPPFDEIARCGFLYSPSRYRAAIFPAPGRATAECTEKRCPAPAARREEPTGGSVSRG